MTSYPSKNAYGPLPVKNPVVSISHNRFYTRPGPGRAIPNANAFHQGVKNTTGY